MKTKEAPEFCENCGREPINKRHYPLEYRKGLGWWCKLCRDKDPRCKCKVKGSK